MNIALYMWILVCTVGTFETITKAWNILEIKEDIFFHRCYSGVIQLSHHQSKGQRCGVGQYMI